MTVLVVVNPPNSQLIWNVPITNSSRTIRVARFSLFTTHILVASKGASNVLLYTSSYFPGFKYVSKNSTSLHTIATLDWTRVCYFFMVCAFVLTSKIIKPGKKTLYNFKIKFSLYYLSSHQRGGYPSDTCVICCIEFKAYLSLAFASLLSSKIKCASKQAMGFVECSDAV